MIKCMSGTLISISYRNFWAPLADKCVSLNPQRPGLGSSAINFDLFRIPVGFKQPTKNSEAPDGPGFKASPTRISVMITNNLIINRGLRTKCCLCFGCIGRPKWPSHSPTLERLEKSASILSMWLARVDSIWCPWASTLPASTCTD